MQMFKVREFAPKHPLQIKFDDITHIDIAGDAVTLHLFSSPACYIKPACGNMEVGRDITEGATTLVFFTGVPPPAATRGGSGNTEVPFSKDQIYANELHTTV